MFFFSSSFGEFFAVSLFGCVAFDFEVIWFRKQAVKNEEGLLHVSCYPFRKEV